MQVMDIPRPLAYASVKSVLQYMEAGIRLKMANCIPSIASTEKLVPLKIDQLEFYPYEIVVNETSYKLGTYRNYPPGVDPLRAHQRKNSKGGVPYDLDQYGFADYSQETIVTAGDVVIKDNNFGDRRGPISDYHAEDLRIELEAYEYALAERLGRVGPMDRGNPLYFLVQISKKYETSKIAKTIDKLEAKLAPVHCRWNKTTRPYSTMVQLTVTRPNGEKAIFRKRSDMKLGEAQKELSNRFFGNRKSTVLVRNLVIAFDMQVSPQMVIRLPQNFQIKAREMCVLDNAAAVCEAIKSLIHSSSYPLKKCGIDHGTTHSSVHPTVYNAEELVFDFGSTFQEGIAEFLQFPNKQIFMYCNKFTPDEYVTLLRNWIENLREVGTSLVSQFGGEPIITEIFEKCKEHLNGSDAGIRSIKIPMSESLEIELTYEFLEEEEEQSAPWKLAIRVVAV